MIRFRYLTDRGHWVDDPQADVQGQQGSLLMLWPPGGFATSARRSPPAGRR